MHTQDELCVGGVGLGLQCSYQDVDKTKPQRQEGHGLVMRPAILLIELSLQQDLKHTKATWLHSQVYRKRSQRIKKKKKNSEDSLYSECDYLVALWS